MNYLEYSKKPSVILKVHEAHITDTDVVDTISLLLQFSTLHFSFFDVFVFFMI